MAQKLLKCEVAEWDMSSVLDYDCRLVTRNVQR
jgi:hypothetical protein